MTTPGERQRRALGAALGACLLLAPAAGAQSLADRLGPLALEPEDVVTSAPERWCATPPIPMPWAATPFAGDPARANVAGDMEALPDGWPLRADQSPRFLHPTHQGSFGFTNLLVLGDHSTVTFERVDAEADDDHTAETWTRTRTDAVAGHVVSVFSPTWDASVLRETLRRYSWGVDVPSLYWGRLVVPGSSDHVNVYLTLAPSNVPSSPVVRIDDNVQYASHVVNIRDADFGDSRIPGGDTALNLPEITKLFYQHFADEYEVIAVVSQATLLAGYSGFHQLVRNDIGGIGLSLYDESSTYGSAGVLQAVEGYPPARWATWETVLHEQGHQYGEYTRAWSQVGPAASAVIPGASSVIDRLGHAPDVHTPLLTPDAVAYGAVLQGKVRVALEPGEAGQSDTYRIERTVPLVKYHPLTLYRMGLLAAADLPALHVFVDQGQFENHTSSAPESGTEVSGGTVQVTVNDLLAADGVRSGPAVGTIRRAVVYVSRDGLAPQSEMDVVNYLARRLGESSGVTSWDRFPSFREATGGGAAMTTDIRRRPPGTAAAAAAESVRCAKVGVDALVGIELDEAFGGCVAAGTSVEVSGVLNLTDEDYYAVCLRFRRYGAPSGERVYACDELNVDRFSIDVDFPADEPGGYTMEAFAFWPDSTPQYPLSTYTGAIEILPSGSSALAPAAR
ncbi:MAG: hypothetical protein OXH75_01630 [Acidobacteria bacterium]|nr:hypothetical protein [Acidobacteriota bacterium]